MRIMIEGESKETAAFPQEAGKRHKRYLEDMAPEYRHEVLGRFFKGLLKEPPDPPPEQEPGTYRVNKAIDVSGDGRALLEWEKISDSECNWTLVL